MSKERKRPYSIAHVVREFTRRGWKSCNSGGGGFIHMFADERSLATRGKEQSQYVAGGLEMSWGTDSFSIMVSIRARYPKSLHLELHERLSRQEHFGRISEQALRMCRLSRNITLDRDDLITLEKTSLRGV